MSEDDAVWRERTGGAWMNGSGARDGFGSPPWDPADPVPDLDDTQAIPGLGDARVTGGFSRVTSGFQPTEGRGQAESSGPSLFQREAADGAGSRNDGRNDNGPNANGRDNNGPNDGGSWGPGPAAQGTSGPPRSGPEGDATDGQQNPKGSKHRKRRSFWRELPILIVVAVVLALVIKTFAIQAFFIPSGSMENTLEVGDRVLINKVVYHLRSIHRGDIIVFDGSGSWDFNNPPASSNIFSKAVDELEGIVGISHDNSIYIKRVIGLPGDHVVCCNTAGQVTVNGVPLSESSYLFPGNAPSTQKFSITVPAGQLWVMGDHRAVSFDSRGHMGDPGGGSIPESAVLGRAFVIIWPPSRWGMLNIPATFEQPKLNASAAAGGNAAAGGSSAALAAALDNGTPVRPATSPLPLALGFAGAVPITWLQRRARTRLRDRRRSRRDRL